MIELSSSKLQPSKHRTDKHKKSLETPRFQAFYPEKNSIAQNSDPIFRTLTAAIARSHL